MLVTGKRFVERIADSGNGRLDPVDSRAYVLAGVLQNGSNAVNKPGDRFHTAAVCQEPSDTINDGCFQVSDRALNRCDGTRRLLGNVRHTEVHDGLIEFFGGNLTCCHSVPEVSGVRAIFEHGLLELSRCAWDRVRQLVPVLCGQLPRTGCLGQHHGNGLERFRIPARNRV